MAKVIVYIDGFNLYYRALRKPQHKWLDIRALIHALLPDDTVLRIKYFTAEIRPSKIDPRKHLRQQIYLRALRTFPDVEICLGNYVQNPARMLLYAAWKEGRKEIVKVLKNEEKGSDVNLAAHLIRDGFLRAFEAAAVLTCDSDLEEPFRIVAEEVGLPIVLLHPYVAKADGTFLEPTRRLRKYTPGAIKKIREGLIGSCQLPERLRDSVGEITRPYEWGPVS